jgi:ATP-dependent exoDNAse (exonuclease V) beta subunit
MESKNFTVYRSSAGSGKTFTLVKEYLRIVLQEPTRFRNILAITFTNKSAAEMKARILKSLKELSGPVPEKPGSTHKSMLPLLIRETGLSGTEIQLKAAEVLKLILHNYSDFSINTIDSFVHRIIRTFTFDLKLPSGFEVEMNVEDLIKEAVDILVSKAGSDEELTKTLIEFSETKADDEKGFNIEKDIFALSKKTLLEEDSSFHLHQLEQFSLSALLKIRKNLVKSRNTFEEKIAGIAGAAYKLIEDNNIDIADFSRGSSGIGNYFKKLSEGRFDTLKPNSYVVDTIASDKWFSGKCPPQARQSIEEISEGLIDAYNELQLLVQSGLSSYKIYGLIVDLFYPLVLLNEVGKILQELKQKDNLVLISEFNRIISEVVMREPVPFIYERLGIKYQHFLIDEFQDTSIMQWHNLLPLVENGLSEACLSLVVGDGKQAIYRWRNGEVEQFAKLPEIFNKPDLPFFNDRENALIRNYNEIKLDSNYRSYSGIVDFNNKLFDFIANSFDDICGSIYSNHAQKPDPDKPGGLVHIELSTGSPEELEPEERVIEWIDEIKEDGFNLNDIGILCRSNKQASKIAAYLLSHGIPVISAESLLLAGYPAICFMLALIRYINNTSDQIAKTEIIRYLHYRKMLGKDDLHTCMRSVLSGNHPKNLFDNSTVPAEGFASLLARNNLKLSVSHLLKMPIYDLCEELIRIFKLNLVADPYIQFFLDAVKEYSVKEGSDSSSFAAWWEEQKSKRSIIVPEGVEAVNIMTVHKSKGLEFPVVIFPPTETNNKNTITQTWININDPELGDLTSAMIPINKKLLETEYEGVYETENAKTRLDFFNLLYVVMTRPIERIYVLTGKASKNPDNMKSVADVFVSYFQSQGLLEEGKNIYTSGKREKKKSSDKESKITTIKPERFISEAWQKRTLISLQAPKQWNMEEPDRNRAWGNLLHTALSFCNKPDDVEKTIIQLKLEGLLSNDKENKLREALQKILHHPELEKIFADESSPMTEAEIITAGGETFRPDRIVINDKGVSILDYKTGRPSDKHKQQINHYGKLLEEMNYTNISKYLVYIDNEIEVVEV